MEEFQKVYDEVMGLVEELKANHTTFVEKGNKAAGMRARTNLGAIKNLVTEYRRLSLEAAK